MASVEEHNSDLAGASASKALLSGATLWSRRQRRVAIRHAVVAGVYVAVALFCMWPMFAPGTPPGTDAPTFLHLGWVVQQALTGHLGHAPGSAAVNSVLNDPYWYGGYEWLASYPPLAYGAIGLLAAITSIPIEISYRVVLFLAYVGLGLSTYALALEMGLQRPAAACAGLLALTAYPVFAGLGVFGWESTIVSLALGIAGLTALERSLRTGSLRWAAGGGAFLAGCLLAHHMTGFAIAMGLAPWALVRLFRASAAERPGVLRLLGVGAGTALVLAGPWAAVFVAHVLKVGFDRQIPGNWNVLFDDFRLRLLDRSFIGTEFYPSYMGMAQVVLAIAGAAYALLTRSRAVMLLPIVAVFLWFAAGQQVNPLIAHYPFSGLDLARFSLYLVPFLGVLGGVVLDAAFAGIGRWGHGRRAGDQGGSESSLANEFAARDPSTEGRQVRRRGLPTRSEGRGSSTALGMTNRRSSGLTKTIAVTVAIVVAAFAVPAADVLAARPSLAPVVPPAGVDTALTWLKTQTPRDAVVLPVGFRNWGAWAIPASTGRAVMDGWNDEGAVDWRPIRQVRYMEWSGHVNTQQLYDIMGQQGTAYVIVAQWSQFDNPKLFEAALVASPGLFQRVASWPGVTVWRRVGSTQ